MLKEFHRYREWIGRTIIVTTAISGYAINKYFDWNQRLNGFEEVILYCGLTGVALLVEYYLIQLPIASKWLRKRLLGNRSIDGIWIEITWEKKKFHRRTREVEEDTLYSIGYCFIRIEDDTFVIDGHAFRTIDRSQDNWKSLTTVFQSDGDLDIMYKLSTAKTGTGDIYAYCKYSFTINSDPIPADSYQASWTYPLDGKKYFCKGRKIKDEALANDIQSNYQSDYDKCMELCQRYFPGSELLTS